MVIDMTHLAVVFNHHTPENLLKKLLKSIIMAAMTEAQVKQRHVQSMSSLIQCFLRTKLGQRLIMYI